MVQLLKSCLDCGRTFTPTRGNVARCPEHEALHRLERSRQRQANKARRQASHRDHEDVKAAMRIAVIKAGRCNRCGAQPYGTLRLEAHWDKKRHGVVHLPVPSKYEVLCTLCHAKATNRGE